MGRTSIPVTNTVRAGVAVVAGSRVAPDAANNHDFANSSGIVVIICVGGMNATAVGNTTLTLIQVADPYGRIQTESTLTVQPNEVGVMGPFPPLLYEGSDGRVDIDCGAAGTNNSLFGIAVL